MLSVSKAPTPKNHSQGERLTSKSRASSKKGLATDMWQENIHFS